MTDSYNINYDEKGKDAGFEDTGIMEIDSDTAITVAMPDGIIPDRYGATVTFHNDTCSNLVIPITLNVLYPSSILVQRWNDVLALTNSEHNGGYTFSAYQ